MTHWIRWVAVGLILLSLFAYSLSVGTVAAVIVIVGAILRLLDLP